MNLFALLLGLGIERLLTHYFHLREFRWLDPLFDTAFDRSASLPATIQLAFVGGLAVLLTLPVMAVSGLLGEHLLSLPYFVFAVIVLLFSLGPRDLKEEVDEYCGAVEADADPERILRLSRELLETDPPDSVEQRDAAVGRAVFVQANNRIFGVVFWFLVLGPAGAWLYRVTDLMRRRASFRHPESGAGDDATIRSSVQRIHGLLAWIPARLLAAAYALAGDFEDATASWRAYHSQRAPRFFDVSNDILASAGAGATDLDGSTADGPPGEPVREAMDLVFRTLWLIWCPVIAVLTLYDFVT